MNLPYEIVIRVSRFYFTLLHRLKVYGKENIIPGSAILASNHTSFFDPPILSAACPEEVHFLARATLFKSKWFGGLISRLNTHPVQGGSKDITIFKMIVKLLSEGKKVIIFPEGTRSFKDELGPIKPGIQLLVTRAKCAIIPTYIHGAYNVWNRKRKFPRLYGKVACVFGSPILYSEFAEMDKKERQAAIAERLTSAINDLRTWYESGAKGSPP